MLNEHLEWETSNESGTGTFPFQAIDLKIYRKKSDYNLAGKLSISCNRTLLSRRVGDGFGDDLQKWEKVNITHSYF
jgi:hypothetical protein